ncbi:alpha/beta hydrolase family protein [Egicoccus sp. AB-alg2]|uniref:alpha/beta hydrolase family protein n=1 Tax=Egicoccus sp. AB-alg2 TaxID=3242693 RepID=UPI00359DB35D
MGSRELTLTTADGLALAGTLTVPDGPGPHPAAVLLVGSGPVDRDSDHRRIPLGVTRDLAEALAAAGIASLRYDKRGVGASQGEFLAASFEECRDDGRAALAALRARPEVDAARVLVIGHSEGAVHAAAIAADESDLAGVVLLAGMAGSGEATLRWQARAIMPTLPAAVRGLLRLLRQDPTKAQDKLFARLRASDARVIRVQGRRLNAAWMRGFLDHDAAADLPRITAPVLAITGDKDLQADPADLQRMETLVRAPLDTRLVPDLNHVLRHTPGTGAIGAYKKQIRTQPLDPRVTEALIGWATARVGARV